MSYKKFPKYLLHWIYPFLLLSILGSITGFLGNQSLQEMLVSLAPLLIFILATILFALASKNEDKEWFIKLVFWICVIAAVNTFIRALLVDDSEFLRQIRWRMLHLSVLVLFAYGLCGLMFNKVYYYQLALIASITIVMLSLTRSYILCFVVMWLTSLLIRSNQKTLSLLPSATVLLILASTIIYLYSDIGTYWFYRISSFSESGFDLTTATRLAEANYQISRLFSNPLNLIFGLGLGAESGYSGIFGDLVNQILRYDLSEKGINGFGHNMFLGFFMLEDLLAYYVFIDS